MNVWNLSSV